MTETRMQFAYSKLREKVWAGDLKPGDQLVNRTLGDELGVSTVTLREAIYRLASDGVVEHVPNAGAYVRKFNAKETVDLFSFRAWIDLYTVREAVRRIESHELHQLRSNCRHMRDILLHLRAASSRVLDGDLRQHWLETDRKFHILLGQAAHNKWLLKAIDDMQLLWHVMRAKLPILNFSDAVWTYRQHCEITRALEHRDIALASEWMRIHGDQALASLLRSLEGEEQHDHAMSALGGRTIGEGISRGRLRFTALTEQEEGDRNS